MFSGVLTAVLSSEREPSKDATVPAIGPAFQQTLRLLGNNGAPNDGAILSQNISTKKGELQPTVNALLTDVSRFKAMGYKVVPELGATGMSENDYPGFMEAFKKLADPNFKFYASSTDPADHLVSHYPVLRNVSPSLSGEDTIRVPAYKVENEWSYSEGKDKKRENFVRVRILDYLHPTKSVLYDKEFTQKYYDAHKAEITKNLVDLMKAQFKSGAPSYKRILDTVPKGDESRIPYSIRAMTSRVQGEEAKAAEKIFSSSSVGIGIDVLPLGAETDRDLRDPKFAESWGYYQFIPKDRWEKLGRPRIELNGEVQGISIVADLDGKYLEEARRLKETLTKDQNGNLLWVSIYQDNPKKVVITILPPFQYATSQDISPRPVTLDYTRFGLGKVGGLIYARSEPLIADYGGVYITSNLQRSDVLPFLTKERQEALTAGAAAAETDFGFRWGELVKNIRIVNSKYPNAFFNPAAPTSINIHDEELKTTPEDLRYTAIHETAHLIDFHMGKGGSFGLSSGPFEKAYLEIKKNNPKFFDQIVEGAFLKDLGVSGGHPKDNAQELFASFAVSLIRPELGRALEIHGRDKKFMHSYQALLDALETNLSNAHLPKTSVIFQKINFARETIIHL